MANLSNNYFPIAGIGGGTGDGYSKTEIDNKLEEKVTGYIKETRPEQIIEWDGVYNPSTDVDLSGNQTIFLHKISDIVDTSELVGTVINYYMRRDELTYTITEDTTYYDVMPGILKSINTGKSREPLFVLLIDMPDYNATAGIYAHCAIEEYIGEMVSSYPYKTIIPPISTIQKIDNRLIDLPCDNEPTENSEHFVKSGDIYSFIKTEISNIVNGNEVAY